jgi:hypothetical protein
LGAVLLALASVHTVTADDPFGACYTAIPIATHYWLGPYQVTLSRCAELAGAQTLHTEDGTSRARWQSYEITVHRDGYFDLYEDTKLVGRRYWKLERLTTDVSADIDAFWERESEAHGWKYVTPKNVRGYTERIRTACGLTILGNAFYCVRSNSIYFDLNLLQRYFTTVGDFAPATVIAHEWGHVIQASTGSKFDTNAEAELQADCFAGVYSRDAVSRGLIDEEDADDIAGFLAKLGDRRTARSSSRAHGTPRQRAAAFMSGYTKGVDTCLK